MSNPNNTSYLGLLILLLIFGIPVIGVMYAANLGAISVIVSVLGGICLLIIAIALLKKAKTNDREMENTAEYIGAFSEGLAKAGLMGAITIGLLLGAWFAMPLFMETINDDFQESCQYTGGGNTSLEKGLCKLK